MPCSVICVTIAALPDWSHRVFAALEESALTLWLNSFLWAFPAAEIFHIVMTGGFFGSILLLDLRLMGVSRLFSARQIHAYIVPKLWWLFGGVVLSGAILFLFMPGEYAGNPAFLLKMLLIVIGGQNAFIMHKALSQYQNYWNDGLPPLAVRLSAALSLLIWVACLACGRLIAYFHGV
jgi:hypothetical protein